MYMFEKNRTWRMSRGEVPVRHATDYYILAEIISALGDNGAGRACRCRTVADGAPTSTDGSEL